MNPTVRSGHVDRLLTNISIAYIQKAEKFVAGKVFPVVPVSMQSNLYVKYDKGFFFRSDMALRALGQAPNQTSYTTSQDGYFAQEYAEEIVIDDRQRANLDDPFDLDRDASRKLTQSGLIFQDVTWASKYFNNSTWTTNYAGVAAAPGANQFLQFNQAGSTPIDTVRNAALAMEQNTGYRPNKLTLGANTYETLINHSTILDRIKYTQKGIVGLDLLAQLFEVDEVMVAKAVVNTAAEGLADNIGFIVNGKGMLLSYTPANPSLLEPSAGYIFGWTGLEPGFNIKEGSVIRRGRDERAKSDWVQGAMAWDMKVVAPDLGAYFATAVA